MENKPHITKKKEKIVSELISLMKDYPVVGIVDMTDLPALQFQRIRSKLRDILEFKMVKKRLIKIALDKSERKDIQKLKDRLEGIPALIFSKEDPFKLAKAIKKETSPAPAKAGQTAPEDIVLPAGPTPFMAGPMIGELGVMGIKTKVESGKINVVQDKVLVNKSDVIEKKIAELLGKLGIEPMQVGFNLLLTYKDGEILEKDVLFVDEKLYLETLQQFARESESLAIHIGYICKDTVKKLLSKAYNEVKAISKVAKLEEKMEVKPEAPKEEKVEEPVKQEEPKVEEKPVEETKEPEKEEPKEEHVEKETEVKEEPKVEEKKEIEESTEEIPKEEKTVVETPKEEPVEEKPQEYSVEDEKEEVKEEPKPEPVKEEPVEEPEPVKEEPKEEPVEEPKEEPKEEEPVEEKPKETEEKKEEEPKEEPKEESEKKKEESRLKDMKEETKIGMKAAKDITKQDIDLAAKQLQEIQDKMIKGGKK